MPHAMRDSARGEQQHALLVFLLGTPVGNIVLAIFIQVVNFAFPLTLFRGRNLLLIGLDHWRHIEKTSQFH
jgi:hypothetical protein